MNTATLGNLKFRISENGKMWNCIFEPYDGTEPILIGAVKMEFVVESKQVEQAFIELMKGCLNATAQDVAGRNLLWGPIVGKESMQ